MMNSRTLLTKRRKFETASTAPKTNEEILSDLMRAAEQSREVFIVGKLRELKKNLEGLNYTLLWSTRLSLISERVTLSTVLSTRRFIMKPAARYLKSILHDISSVFLKDEETIFKYLIESLNNNSVQNNAHVIMLADILLNFKLSIEKTGLLSKEAGVFEKPGLSNYLNSRCNWVTYFYAVIKNGLVKMSIDDDTNKITLDLVDKLQSMQDLIYRSLQKNFPYLVDKYPQLEYLPRRFKKVSPLNFFGSHPSSDTPGDMPNEGSKLKLGKQ